MKNIFKRVGNLKENQNYISNNEIIKLEKIEKTLNNIILQIDIINKKINYLENKYNAINNKTFYLDNNNINKIKQKDNKKKSILYLAAPTEDGFFYDFSKKEEIGKSIYLLRTDDMQNGTFSVINSTDAIATAMISISQFIKPACKIKNNNQKYTTHILTEESGHAVFENNGWKITKKAIINFE